MMCHGSCVTTGKQMCVHMHICVTCISIHVCVYIYMCVCAGSSRGGLSIYVGADILTCQTQLCPAQAKHCKRLPFRQHVPGSWAELTKHVNFQQLRVHHKMIAGPGFIRFHPTQTPSATPRLRLYCALLMHFSHHENCSQQGPAWSWWRSSWLVYRRCPLLLEIFFPRFPRHGLCHTVDGSTQMQVLGKQLAKSCRKSALE